MKRPGWEVVMILIFMSAGALGLISLGFYLTTLKVSPGLSNQSDDPEKFWDRRIEIEVPVRFVFRVDGQTERRVLRNVQITCYRDRVEECDSTPSEMWGGRMVYEGAIAVSWDLYGKYCYAGDVVYIKKLNRYFIVEDKMNQRHKNSIDVFIYKDHETEVRKFKTIRSDVEVMGLKRKSR